MNVEIALRSFRTHPFSVKRDEFRMTAVMFQVETTNLLLKRNMSCFQPAQISVSPTSHLARRDPFFEVRQTGGDNAQTYRPTALEAALQNGERMNFLSSSELNRGGRILDSRRVSLVTCWKEFSLCRRAVGVLLRLENE